MKNKLLYLLLTVLLATVVMACSSGTEKIIPEAEPTYRADLMLRADAGNGEVTLDWLMDPYAETYNIYVGTSRNSLTKVATGVISAPFTVTQLADGTPLTNGTIYYFSVSGENENDESDLAIPITAIPLANPRPLAPENVRANAGNQQVTVTWTPVDGVDGYTVYCIWQTSATDLGQAYLAVAGQASNSLVVSSVYWTYRSEGGVVMNGTTTGLVNGRTYTFWVASIKGGVESSASFPAYATPTATPPPMAPVLTSAVADNGKVTLYWDASVTGNPPVVDSSVIDYKIYIGTAKGVTKLTGVETVITADGSPSYAAEAPLTNGTTYYFVITARNANGESAESNEWWATPSATTPSSGISGVSYMSGISTNSSGVLIIYAH